MSEKALEGKVAIVTGAGRGLGLGIARELAGAGANVGVLELDAESAEEAAQELGELGITARAYPTDVTQSDQVDAAFNAVARDFGRLDIAVNNAGISRVGPFTQDVTDEDWHDSIAVMQTGVFFCMRAAGRIMLPQASGSVVNISSIRGFSPNTGRMTYCAPKAAVIMMTQVAAGEWAPHGVRVNAVCPGVLRTPMWDEDVARGAIDEDFYVGVVPAHRLGETWEVGKLILYVCSDDAAYMTGAVLTIDGALTSIPAA
jgi:NAD(P)-dependent dehydrogenase (short-subunit alcohol dehydrogenase family)